jgi:hypothetical protein
MSRDCVTVNRAMNLQEFVDAFLLKTGQRCYAVEDHSHLVGPITPRDVGAIPREHWDKTTVRDAMRPLEPLHVITPDTPVLALKLMVGNDVKQLPVVANGTMSRDCLAFPAQAAIAGPVGAASPGRPASGNYSAWVDALSFVCPRRLLKESKR